MWAKAKQEKVNCWLWENTNGAMGWPEELNYDGRRPDARD